jgi:hypothetical protein
VAPLVEFASLMRNFAHTESIARLLRSNTKLELAVEKPRP